jgi:hypothetical protein
LAACSSERVCLETLCLLSVYCLSGWLPACRRLLVWKLLMYRMFIVCLAGCLLIRSCLSGNGFCSVCLLSVWLAACSSEAARRRIMYELYVDCLSGWLLAGRRLLVWKLLIQRLLSANCVLVVCLAGCLLIGGFASENRFFIVCSGWLPARRWLLVWRLLIHCLFIVCLTGCMLARGCLSENCVFIVFLLSVQPVACPPACPVACHLEAACLDVFIYCLL